MSPDSDSDASTITPERYREAEARRKAARRAVLTPIFRKLDPDYIPIGPRTLARRRKAAMAQTTPSRSSASPSSSPRLPSPPPFTEVQFGPKSPGVGPGINNFSLDETNKPDQGASRRIRKGTKAADMAVGPPLVSLEDVRTFSDAELTMLTLLARFGIPTRRTSDGSAFQSSSRSCDRPHAPTHQRTSPSTRPTTDHQ